jgi:hypothetical protein
LLPGVGEPAPWDGLAELGAAVGPAGEDVGVAAPWQAANTRIVESNSPDPVYLRLSLTTGRTISSRYCTQMGGVGPLGGQASGVVFAWQCRQSPNSSSRCVSIR